MSSTITEGGKVKLTIKKGTTYKYDFFFVDADGVAVNLTDYTARMQIRESHESATVLHESTSANGEFAITGATGKVSLSIPAASTAAWTFDAGVYDIELVSPSGDVTGLVEGAVIIKPEVTR